MVRKISKLIIVILLTAGCDVSTKNIPNQEDLRIAIAESIKIPFNKNDTVIYNSFIGICGNSTNDELKRYYEPKLSETPYSSILIKNYKGKVLFTDENIYKLADSICQNEKAFKNTWDCFSRNKIDFSLTGWLISNNTVEVYEKYKLKDSIHFITKVFEYYNNQWSFYIKKDYQTNLNI